MIVTYHRLVPDSEADLAEEVDAHAALHAALYLKVSTMLKVSGVVKSALLAVVCVVLTDPGTSFGPHQTRVMSLDSVQVLHMFCQETARMASG